MEFPRFSLMIGLAVALPLAAATAQTANETPATGNQAALDQQREQIRKQEAVFRVAPTLNDAERLEQAGDYAKAREIYLAALNVVTPSPAAQPVYNRAVAGLLRCNAQLIEVARKKNDLPTMESLLTSSLTYDPNNAELKANLAKVEAARRNPQATTLYTNPAVSDQFRKQVDSVEQLFAEAEQARRTGQYDLAETKLKAILGLDPYNTTAEKKLKQITDEKLRYAQVAQDENRQKSLREVEERWSNPVRQQTLDATPTASNTPLTRSNQFEISQKLRSIVFPSVDFTDATLQNAVDFLNDRTRQLDPDQVGINFIPRPEALTQAKPITLSLKKVPLGEVLRYVSQLAQVKYKVDQSAVFFVPIASSTDVLVRRQFNIPPSFFTVSSGPSDDTAAAAGGNARRRTTALPVSTGGGSQDVKDQLTQRGVEFSAEGANATYLSSSGILQVVDTQDQMDLIEELVNAETGQTLMVNIEARFVEINQTDLNDVTFNWMFGSVAPLRSNSPGILTTMRGSGGFSVNNLTALINTQVGTPGYIGTTGNQFLLSGVLAANVYSAALSALAQKTSTDLLSAPSVRVRSSERATINATRTFYYPTSYDAPQIVSQTTQTGGGITIVAPIPPAAIPAFPSAFDKQEVGVILNVQPTVGGDGRTIDLSLVPEITDFQGFINYGDPITVNPQDGVANDLRTLVQNQILQPVFNVRRVSTKVLVRDGYTVVIGGLIREDIQTINDKVPIIGDLPLIGRLFQSKASQNIKKNLLIFVTGKIVRSDGELLHPDDTTVSASDASGTSTVVR